MMLSKEWRGRATIRQRGPQLSIDCELKFDPSQGGPEGQWSGKFTSQIEELDVGDAELIVNGEVVSVRVTKAPKDGNEGEFLGLGRPPTL